MNRSSWYCILCLHCVNGKWAKYLSKCRFWQVFLRCHKKHMLWYFIWMPNMTYHIHRIDRALFNLSFLSSCIWQNGMKHSSYNYRSSEKMESTVFEWRSILNWICLIKSIVILINSTENCHCCCHDSVFPLLWDWIPFDIVCVFRT